MQAPCGLINCSSGEMQTSQVKFTLIVILITNLDICAQTNMDSCMDSVLFLQVSKKKQQTKFLFCLLSAARQLESRNENDQLLINTDLRDPVL